MASDNPFAALEHLARMAVLLALMLFVNVLALYCAWRLSERVIVRAIVSSSVAAEVVLVYGAYRWWGAQNSLAIAFTLPLGVCLGYSCFRLVLRDMQSQHISAIAVAAIPTAAFLWFEWPLPVSTLIAMASLAAAIAVIGVVTGVVSLALEAHMDERKRLEDEQWALQRAAEEQAEARRERIRLEQKKELDLQREVRERARREAAAHEQALKAEAAERAAAIKRRQDQEEAEKAAMRERRDSAQNIALEQSIEVDGQTGVTAKELVRRQRGVLDDLYAVTGGHVKRKAAMDTLAKRTDLSLAQVYGALTVLEGDGLVRLRSEYNRLEWSDILVELTREGAKEVAEREGRRGMGPKYNIKMGEKSKASFFNDVHAQNIISNVDRLSQAEGVPSIAESEIKRAMQALMEEVGNLTAHSPDVADNSRLGAALRELETAENPEVVGGVMEKLMGIAKVLGPVAVQMSTAAEAVYRMILGSR